MPKFKEVRYEKEYSDIYNGIIVLINNFIRINKGKLNAANL